MSAASNSKQNIDPSARLGTDEQRNLGNHDEVKNALQETKGSKLARNIRQLCYFTAYGVTALVVGLTTEAVLHKQNKNPGKVQPAVPPPAQKKENPNEPIDDPNILDFKNLPPPPPIQIHGEFSA